MINSLASYSRINQYGFIETPYRIVTNGKVTDRVIYLSAINEEDFVIAQANAEVDSNGKFINEVVSAGAFLPIVGFATIKSDGMNTS